VELQLQTPYSSLKSGAELSPNYSVAKAEEDQRREIEALVQDITLPQNRHVSVAPIQPELARFQAGLTGADGRTSTENS